MSVRAKFLVTRNEKNPNGNDHQIALETVYDDGKSPENAAFFAATPAGRITLGVVNAEAAKQLEVGEYYYVDFTKAE